jgi:cysteine desulfurase
VVFDVESVRADLVSFTAHKIHGPKGVGALYVRRRTQLTPIVFGGGHERGLRSGTLNVPGIVGFGTAAALCQQEMTDESERLRALGDRLNAELHARLDGVLVNGSMTDRLPHNLNLSFTGVDGESRPEPSHVLRAIGRDEDLARASLRFGLCRSNTDEEVDYVVETVAGLVTRLRGASPFDEFAADAAELPSKEYD